MTSLPGVSRTVRSRVGMALLVPLLALGLVGWLRHTPDPAVATSAPTQATSAPSPSAPHTVRVVGLGDSVASGWGLPEGTDYVSRYAASLTPTGQAVNLAEPGATTTDVTDQLHTEQSARSAVAAADIILVTVGANDLNGLVDAWDLGGCDASCITPAVTRMGTDLSATLDALNTARPVGSRVYVTDYWNVFEDGQAAIDDQGSAFPAWSDQVTREANTTICTVARAHGALCVDLWTPFKGTDGRADPTAFLQSDGDHPNAAGVDLIVEALQRAGA